MAEVLDWLPGWRLGSLSAACWPRHVHLIRSVEPIAGATADDTTATSRQVLTDADIGAVIMTGARSGDGTSFPSLRKEMVERDIAARGVRDELVLDAMRKVPRELFLPSAFVNSPTRIRHCRLQASRQSLSPISLRS